MSLAYGRLGSECCHDMEISFDLGKMEYISALPDLFDDLFFAQLGFTGLVHIGLD